MTFSELLSPELEMGLLREQLSIWALGILHANE
jgi:hypothetical protein